MKQVRWVRSMFGKEEEQAPTESPILTLRQSASDDSLQRSSAVRATLSESQLLSVKPHRQVGQRPRSKSGNGDTTATTTITSSKRRTIRELSLRRRDSMDSIIDLLLDHWKQLGWTVHYSSSTVGRECFCPEQGIYTELWRDEQSLAGRMVLLLTEPIQELNCFQDMLASLVPDPDCLHISCSERHLFFRKFREPSPRFPVRPASADC